MTAQQRFESLSVFVFGTTLSAAIYFHETVNMKVLFGEYSGVVIVVLGLLSYDLVYKVCLHAIKHIDSLRKYTGGRCISKVCGNTLLSTAIANS
jgi:hypothetical protein